MIKLKFFTSFLSRLSKREKVVFYVAIVAVAWALFDRLLFSPVIQRMESLSTEIQNKESDRKRMSFILSQKDRIVAESAKYIKFLSKAKNVDEETTTILKEIEEIANNNSMYIVDLKPLGLRETGQAKKYTVSITCEGQMEDVFKFMYNIESSPQLLRIERCEIIPKSTESSIASCNLMMSKMIFE